jgi:hypothetical protein
MATFAGFPVSDDVEHVPPDTLRPWQPRWVWPPDWTGTPGHDALRRSLDEGGVVWRPLLALPDGTVVDGAARLRAAAALGLATVPVRRVQVPLPLTGAAQLAIELEAATLALSARHLEPHQWRELLSCLDTASGVRAHQVEQAEAAEEEIRADQGAARLGPDRPPQPPTGTVVPLRRVPPRGAPVATAPAPRTRGASAVALAAAADAAADEAGAAAPEEGLTEADWLAQHRQLAAVLDRLVAHEEALLPLARRAGVDCQRALRYALARVDAALDALTHTLAAAWRAKGAPA